VSAAEDPEKILDQAVADMQGDLIRLRQAAAEVTASQKKMQNKYEQAAATADDWYRRAELALSKGDEELAKEALTRRKAFSVSRVWVGGWARWVGLGAWDLTCVAGLAAITATTCSQAAHTQNQHTSYPALPNTSPAPTPCRTTRRC
jgi:hypothetical protein